ncbi:vimentin-like [Sardina pilchardus]|uniref:vimentin-like n=1 Tax=Sardina pilchardus TaxID=27697 RepID=UPI002E143295
MNKFDEKKELQNLNSRLAIYMSNVRQLQLTNDTYSKELEELKGSRDPFMKQLYEEETTTLRIQVEQLNKENAHFEFNNQELSGKLQEFEDKLSKQEVDKVSLIYMEKKVKSLEDQIIHLKKVHNEEITQLRAQNQYVQTDMNMVRPQLTAALEEVREYYERRAQMNLQESPYTLQETTHSETKQKLEVITYHEKVQTLTSEKVSMQHTIEEMKSKLSSTEVSYQEKIKVLEADNSRMENAIKSNQCKYDELFHAKVALDAEILCYRQLLEGEERRIVSPVKETKKVDKSVTRTPTATAIPEGKVRESSNPNSVGTQQSPQGTKPTAQDGGSSKVKNTDQKKVHG